MKTENTNQIDEELNELEKDIKLEEKEIKDLKSILKHEEDELEKLEEKLEDLKKHRGPIKVFVNKHPVEFEKHIATGMEIKTEAIKQGVQIKEDFNLFEKEGGSLKPISDDQEVKLCKDQDFRAVAPDDHSML